MSKNDVVIEVTPPGMARREGAIKTTSVDTPAPGSLDEARAKKAVAKAAADKATLEHDQIIAALAENEHFVNRPLENHRLMSEDIERAQGFRDSYIPQIAQLRAENDVLIGNRNSDGRNIWNRMQPIINLERAIEEVDRWIVAKKLELAALEKDIAVVVRTRSLGYRLPQHLAHLKDQ